MLLGCNGHLSESVRDPDEYQGLPMELRTALAAQVEDICLKVRGLTPLSQAQG